MKSLQGNTALVEPGFAASLLKPIIPAKIRDVLALAFEKEGQSDTEIKDEREFSHKDGMKEASTSDVKARPSTIEKTAQPISTRNRNARILLVEDNPLNCEVALSILDDLNYQADVAENGVQALRALVSAGSENPYDLILMDCQMPEMDGYEATHKIRGGQLGIHNYSIIIIAMTANAMKGDREKCIEAGMDDYLTKPINVAVLQDTLDKWLER